MFIDYVVAIFHQQMLERKKPSLQRHRLGCCNIAKFWAVEKHTLTEGKPPPTDWNDFATLRGRNKLRSVIEAEFKSKGMTIPEIKPEAKPAIAQAQRDAAWQTAVSIPQTQVQHDAMRTWQWQQEYRRYNKGLFR